MGANWRALVTSEKALAVLGTVLVLLPSYKNVAEDSGEWWHIRERLLQRNCQGSAEMDVHHIPRAFRICSDLHRRGLLARGGRHIADDKMDEERPMSPVPDGVEVTNSSHFHKIHELKKNKKSTEKYRRYRDFYRNYREDPFEDDAANRTLSVDELRKLLQTDSSDERKTQLIIDEHNRKKATREEKKLKKLKDREEWLSSILSDEKGFERLFNRSKEQLEIARMNKLQRRRERRKRFDYRVKSGREKSAYEEYKGWTTSDGDFFTESGQAKPAIDIGAIAYASSGFSDSRSEEREDSDSTNQHNSTAGLLSKSFSKAYSFFQAKAKSGSEGHSDESAATLAELSRSAFNGFTDSEDERKSLEGIRYARAEDAGEWEYRRREALARAIELERTIGDSQRQKLHGLKETEDMQPDIAPSTVSITPITQLDSEKIALSADKMKRSRAKKEREQNRLYPHQQKRRDSNPCQNFSLNLSHFNKSGLPSNNESFVEDILDDLRNLFISPHNGSDFESNVEDEISREVKKEAFEKKDRKFTQFVQMKEKEYVSKFMIDPAMPTMVRLLQLVENDVEWTHTKNTEELRSYVASNTGNPGCFYNKDYNNSIAHIPRGQLLFRIKQIQLHNYLEGVREGPSLLSDQMSGISPILEKNSTYLNSDTDDDLKKECVAGYLEKINGNDLSRALSCLILVHRLGVLDADDEIVRIRRRLQSSVRAARRGLRIHKKASPGFHIPPSLLALRADQQAESRWVDFASKLATEIDKRQPHVHFDKYLNTLPDIVSARECLDDLLIPMGHQRRSEVYHITHKAVLRNTLSAHLPTWITPEITSAEARSERKQLKKSRLNTVRNGIPHNAMEAEFAPISESDSDYISASTYINEDLYGPKRKHELDNPPSLVSEINAGYAAIKPFSRRPSLATGGIILSGRVFRKGLHKVSSKSVANYAKGKVCSNQFVVAKLWTSVDENKTTKESVDEKMDCSHDNVGASGSRNDSRPSVEDVLLEAKEILEGLVASVLPKLNHGSNHDCNASFSVLERSACNQKLQWRESTSFLTDPTLDFNVFDTRLKQWITIGTVGVLQQGVLLNCARDPGISIGWVISMEMEQLSLFVNSSVDPVE
mmetsp:Transcript_31496/g.76849  ORF Transcript_31496/g.76849 Transcript_31496/m.76849 type:complete len:1112 (+) Transcript_31496:185-3520(+)